MQPTEDRLLTIREVADRLRVKPRTVRWLIRNQQLTAQRIDPGTLIYESDLHAFIDANTVPALHDWEGEPDEH
jgi:excisionase family DNA binding protein